MTGRWLTAISHQVLRADTFKHVMAPAIADAQHESPSASRAARVRNGFALAWTLTLAALGDLRLDVQATCSGQTIRTVWLPAVGWTYAWFAFNASAAIGLRAAFPFMYANVEPLQFGPLALLRDLVLGPFPTVLVPAAFMIARHGRSVSRSLVAAAAAISVLSIATGPLATLLITQRWESAVSFYIPAAARELLILPAMAMVGLSLSYSRRWRIAARLAALLFGNLLLQILFQILSRLLTGVDWRPFWAPSVIWLLLAFVSLRVGGKPQPATARSVA